LLPFIAEEIFEELSDRSGSDYFANEPVSITVSDAPALMQNSSWSRLIRGDKLELRQVALVTQIREQLYVFRTMMNAQLTEITFDVFLHLLKTVRFEQPAEKPTTYEQDKKVDEPKIDPVASPISATGRWRGRQPKT